jgi:hypothetical protein
VQVRERGGHNNTFVVDDCALARSNAAADHDHGSAVLRQVSPTLQSRRRVEKREREREREGKPTAWEKAAACLQVE